MDWPSSFPGDHLGVCAPPAQCRWPGQGAGSCGPMFGDRHLWPAWEWLWLGLSLGPPPEQAVGKTINQKPSLPWSTWRFREMV